LCAEDCTIGPYKLKKGTIIHFPIYAMHHNPKFFPDPEKFRPERFLKSENPVSPASQFSYIPFGGGPRVCIGMRFAMAEMKIAMAKLLAEFRIVSTPETRLDLMEGDSFLFNYPEVRVKLERRTV
jgi:cytochrome P450